ncbi:hypothetical protein [Cryptosporangium phraense]|uniref:Uncharacterized protein n=1 Tax=Cryptosporangium phraense TaxID=2593070 RepID=A0A545ASK7_9ACTN|nr:hypothetical protein [Cryptosporangium phraense]TQS44320.1 hypothetical protein FL583_15420 [Cryptosporangium phraense]
MRKPNPLSCTIYAGSLTWSGALTVAAIDEILDYLRSGTASGRMLELPPEDAYTENPGGYQNYKTGTDYTYLRWDAIDGIKVRARGEDQWPA